MCAKLILEGVSVCVLFGFAGFPIALTWQGSSRSSDLNGEIRGEKNEKKREKLLNRGWMCEEEATAGHSFLLGIKHSSRFLSVTRIFL